MTVRAGGEKSRSHSASLKVAEHSFAGSQRETPRTARVLNWTTKMAAKKAMVLRRRYLKIYLLKHWDI